MLSIAGDRGCRERRSQSNKQAEVVGAIADTRTMFDGKGVNHLTLRTGAVLVG